MPRLYHITSSHQVEEARIAGEYVPSAFAEEGFIHCSYAHQVTQVANAFYRGQRDLVLLEIDRTALTCAVIDENLEGGSELFPHIYGLLPLIAVIRTHPFPCGADGSFSLPPTVSPVDN